MPKASAVKIASVLKPGLSKFPFTRLFILAGVILIAVLAINLWKLNQVQLLPAQINGKSYKLLTATTTAEQQKGLGDRASLPSVEGMLFEFSDLQIRCFWMKDMRFPLDIIWLNANRQIRFIEPDISPKTYPKTFCPNVPTEYVIELNAGQAAQDGMRLGQTVQF